METVSGLDPRLPQWRVDGGLRVEEHPLDLAAALTGIMRLVHDVAVDLVPVAG